MSLTDSLENSLLNLVFRGDAYTPPLGVYIALFTAAPDDEGGGTELAGDGYMRMPVSFTESTEGSTENDAAVTFPAATDDWGVITHSALMDADEDGEMLCHGALTASRTIADGEIFMFPSGSIVVTLD